jgi:hypothetical protein
MDDDLRIAMGVELVSTRFEISAQFQKVINFSIENNPDGPVFIVNGLPASGDINDAQPPHPETDWPVGVDTFVVRSAVNDGLAHPTNIVCVDRLIRPPDYARYATQGFTSTATFSVGCCHSTMLSDAVCSFVIALLCATDLVKT